MTSLFETSTITLWAWRLPFWFGGAMGLFVVWIRENLEETPEFLQIEHQQRHQSIWKPAGDILRSHKRHIFAGISLSLIHAALVTTYLYFPLFIHKFYGHAKSDIYCAMTLGLVWCALIIPRIGRLADSLGRRVLYTLAGIGFLMVMTPSLQLLSLGFGGLVAFCMLFQVFIAGFVSSYFPLLVELFPTQVRFTAIALCYNITYALISLLPVAFSALLDQPPTILSHILMGLCGVSLAGCLMVKKQPLV